MALDGGDREEGAAAGGQTCGQELTQKLTIKDLGSLQQS